MPNTPPTGGTWGSYKIIEGPWKLADWRRWIDAGHTIDGVTNLTAFINWANTNFAESIPRSPMGGDTTGTGWNENEWNVWFTQHTDASWTANNWYQFCIWAKDTYSGKDMPNTPPTAAGNPATPETPDNSSGNSGSSPATPDTGTESSNPIDDLLNAIGGATGRTAGLGAAGNAASKAAKPVRDVLDSRERSYADAGLSSGW